MPGLCGSFISTDDDKSWNDDEKIDVGDAYERGHETDENMFATAPQDICPGRTAVV
jgi:hypothetical protein